jgi:tRNA (guanine-N7-)-methyltransferase
MNDEKRSRSVLDYQGTSFSQGRMDFAWEEVSEEERQQLYADWQAGKGLIGGHPRHRPGHDRLPEWGVNQPFFRTFALDDPRGWNGERLRAEMASARPLEVEIGFGRGDFLLDRAARHPDRLFIGYEVKTRAVRLALQRLERMALTNLWLSDDDVRVSLPEVIPSRRIDVVHVLFPDPWWKEEHKIRRLFSPPLVDLLAEKVRPGGLLHFKSDVEQYNELVRYLVGQHPTFSEHSPELERQIGPHVPTHREYWCKERNLPVWASFFCTESVTRNA